MEHLHVLIGLETLASCAALRGSRRLRRRALSDGVPQLVSPPRRPAVDRGVRDLEVPREPRTDATSRASEARTVSRGSVIVKFRPGTSTDVRRSAPRAGGRHGRRPHPATRRSKSLRSIVPPIRKRSHGVSTSQPDVEYAQARYRVYPRFTPNDPQYARQWNFPAIDMERAWDINQGATPSITVAVLDSGVAFRSAVMRYDARAFTAIDGPIGPHVSGAGTVDVPFAAAPDLDGANRFVSPRDFIWETTTPFDLDGHGTHVAGTVGQLTNNGVGRRGHGVQRPHHARQSHRRRMGRHFRQPTDRHRRRRGERHQVRGGQRREGHQPEHRALRSARRLSCTRRSMYAVSRGAFVVVAGGNGFEEGNDHREDRGIRARHRRHGRCWSDRPRSAAGLLLEHGTVHRAGGSWRQHPRRWNRRRHPPADVSTLISSTRSCAGPASTARRGSTCSLTISFKGVRWRRLTWPASRPAHAARHYEPGSHRGRHEAIRDRSGRARTRQRIWLRTDQSTRASLRGLGLAR